MEYLEIDRQINKQRHTQSESTQEAHSKFCVHLNYRVSVPMEKHRYYCIGNWEASIISYSPCPWPHSQLSRREERCAEGSDQSREHWEHMVSSYTQQDVENFLIPSCLRMQPPLASPLHRWSVEGKFMWLTPSLWALLWKQASSVLGSWAVPASPRPQSHVHPTLRTQPVAGQSRSGQRAQFSMEILSVH